MRRKLSLAYIGLLLPFLFSCEKEIVEPTTVAEASAIAEASTASCDTYSYTTKSGSVEQFGQAWGEIILVGFQQDLSLDARKQVLSMYSSSASIAGETYMDSGVITEVHLKAGSSCFEAEKLRRSLEKSTKVNFTAPVFYGLPQDEGFNQWTGLSNEMMVSIEPGSMAQLEQFMQRTGTELVFSFSDEIHVLSVSKTSAGNALQTCTYLNQASFVTEAVPNFIYKQLPVEEGGATAQASSTETSVSRKKGKGKLK